MRRILFTFLFVAAAAVFGALYGASAASADEGVLTQGLPTDGLPTEGLPTDGLPTGGSGVDLTVDVSVDPSVQAGATGCCTGGEAEAEAATEAQAAADADARADAEADAAAEVTGDGALRAQGPERTRARFTGRITAELSVDLAGRVPNGPDGEPLDCPLPEDVAGDDLELPELPEMPELPELPEAPELPDLPEGGDGLDGLTDQLSPVCDCLAGLADLAGGNGLDGLGLDGLEAMAGAVPDPGDIPTMVESPETALVGPMVAMSQLPSPVGDVPITLLQLQQQLAG